MEYGIHWFRRDLRIAGNTALQRHFRERDGKIVGLFCFDKKFLSRDDFSANRFQFFLNSIQSLKEELEKVGSDLLVLDEGPSEAFPLLLKELEKNDCDRPCSVSWNRDYEPFARDRDEKMTEFFKEEEIEVYTERDHLLIEPSELEKNDGGGYQVYSPFAKKWLEIFKDDEVQWRLKQQEKAVEYLEKLKKGHTKKVFDLSWKSLFDKSVPLKDHLESYQKDNQKKVTIDIPEAGSVAALKKVEAFKKIIDDYGDKRDIPIERGTSELSVFMKNGTLTVPLLIKLLDLKPYKKKEGGRDTFFSELIWREFYYHVLARNPRVEKESFLKQYKKLPWSNNKKHFEAWKEGKTGYPIVDAGMRQLKATGWMHNRVRMIVASFLCKHLLINWQWGEKYFMKTLLDGDLAPNNGGWQWAASTGCDPQPYFRIFNPWLQSKKFDEKGEYIRKYVPELCDCEDKQLHEPILNHKEYPKPIVEHSEARERALEVYKKASN